MGLWSVSHQLSNQERLRNMPAEATLSMSHLRTCLGYLANGSQQTVSISQDDATSTFNVIVGDQNKREYWGNSLEEALFKAAQAEKDPDYD